MSKDTTPVVDAISQMHLEGNVVPHSWYKIITYESGKPDVNAILILAEIVYWYRARIVRDEYSGEVISVHKRFSADKLQRGYQSFAEQFGLSKRQCQDAVLHLCELGLVTKETRTVDTPRGRIGNVLFLEPIPEAIQRISSYVSTYKPIHSNVQAPTSQGMTYTRDYIQETSQVSDDDDKAAVAAGSSKKPTSTSSSNYPEPKKANDPEREAVLAAWRENMPQPIVADLNIRLSSLQDEVGAAAIIHGISVAVEHDKRNFAYVATCARNHAAGVQKPRKAAGGAGRKRENQPEDYTDLPRRNYRPDEYSDIILG